MCDTCEIEGLARRDLFKFGVAGLATAALAAGYGSARAAGGVATTLSPDEALAALKTGNERYLSHPELCASDLAERRAAVAEHQAPWATIISCADSRVPPELIFGGHGVGELFVARNAGNLVDTATLGTVEYGAAVLGSPLIVVLAHKSCGAVKAACDIATKNATYPGAIGPMVEPIVPAALAARAKCRRLCRQRRQGKRPANEATWLTATSTLIAEARRAGQSEGRRGDLRFAERRRLVP